MSNHSNHSNQTVQPGGDCPAEGIDSKLTEVPTLSIALFIPKPQLLISCTCQVDPLLDRFFHLMHILANGFTNNESIVRSLTTKDIITFETLVDDLATLEGDRTLFHEMVRKNIVLDPERWETRFAHLFYLAKEVQAELRIQYIIDQFNEEINQWAGVACDSEHVSIDPENMPASVFTVALLPVQVKTESMDQFCLICDRKFQFDTGGTAGDLEDDNSERVAMKTICNHHFCRECLETWRKQGLGGKYACPLCRCCLVCGNQDCPTHVTEEELAHPIPLPDAVTMVSLQLGITFPPIDCVSCRDLREQTRPNRVQLAYYQELMGHKDITEERRRELKDTVKAIFVRLSLDVMEYVEI